MTLVANVGTVVTARLTLVFRPLTPVVPPLAQERPELAHVPLWLAVTVLFAVLLLLLTVFAASGVPVLPHLVLLRVLLAVLPALLLGALPTEEQPEQR